MIIYYCEASKRRYFTDFDTTDYLMHPYKNCGYYDLSLSLSLSFFLSFCLSLSLFLSGLIN